MEHDWESVLVEYYEMDSDWVCKSCQARVSRDHQRGKGGSYLDSRETLEEFKVRLTSPWLAWRKIPTECSGK